MANLFASVNLEMIRGNYWQYQELHRRRRIKRRIFKAAIVGVLCLIIFGVINHG
jgi:nitrogen fixation/metabolism regulation signal transduction histidine kinase